MNSCFKLVSFYILIFTCLYIIYQLFTFEISESKKCKQRRINKIQNNINNDLFNGVNIFRIRIIFGMIFLIFLNYNFYFNQKINR